MESKNQAIKTCLLASSSFPSSPSCIVRLFAACAAAGVCRGGRVLLNIACFVLGEWLQAHAVKNTNTHKALRPVHCVHLFAGHSMLHTPSSLQATDGHKELRACVHACVCVSLCVCVSVCLCVCVFCLPIHNDPNYFHSVSNIVFQRFSHKNTFKICFFLSVSK